VYYSNFLNLQFLSKYILVKWCENMLKSLYKNSIYSSAVFDKGFVYTGAVPKMKEDFFAKSRNGHLLKDTFNRENNTLDIYSSGLYPANVLSNLAPKEFYFDGVKCASIEGFLQSLKIKDKQKQKEVCQLYGGSAKERSKKFTGWLYTHKLYWLEQEFDRFSKKYNELLVRAFKACYDQNEIFRDALGSTKGKILTHTNGKSDAKTTIITKEEFIKILTDLRDNNI